MNHCEENKPAEELDEEGLRAFTRRARLFLLELDVLLEEPATTVQKLRANILLLTAMKAALYEGYSEGLEVGHATGYDVGREER